MAAPTAPVGVKLTKAHVRYLARLYAAKQVSAQDMPEWPFENGHFKADDDKAMDEFMDELRRISYRIKSTIPSDALAALNAGGAKP